MYKTNLARKIIVTVSASGAYYSPEDLFIYLDKSQTCSREDFYNTFDQLKLNNQIRCIGSAGTVELTEKSYNILKRPLTKLWSSITNNPTIAAIIGTVSLVGLTILVKKYNLG